jgi:selenide,water dikinase
VLREILKGGIDKVRESGTSLLGGHSVEDEEIKYGLSVTGLVHPERIVRNEGARPGDVLVLTKPLGMGILVTAMKGNRVSPEAEARLIATMAALNGRASEAMLAANVHAATDVTGFGLAGHLKEMIKEDIGVDVYGDMLPCLPEAEALFAEGFAPGGYHKNREFYGPFVEAGVEGFPLDLIFDPQSSGGLLIALGEEDMDLFRREASVRSLDYRVIGRFGGPAGRIRLLPQAPFGV